MRHKRRLAAHAETSCSVAALLVNINSWSVFCTQPYTEHTLRDGGAHAPGIINIYDCIRAQKPPHRLIFPHLFFPAYSTRRGAACGIFCTVWFRADFFYRRRVAFNISRPAVGDKQLISKLSLNFNGRPLKCQIYPLTWMHREFYRSAEGERERRFLSLLGTSNLTRQTHINVQINSVHLFAQLCCGLITTTLLHSWRKASSFWPMRTLGIEFIKRCVILFRA